MDLGEPMLVFGSFELPAGEPGALVSQVSRWNGISFTPIFLPSTRALLRRQAVEAADSVANLMTASFLLKKI